MMARRSILCRGTVIALLACMLCGCARGSASEVPSVLFETRDGAFYIIDVRELAVRLEFDYDQDKSTSGGVRYWMGRDPQGSEWTLSRRPWGQQAEYTQAGAARMKPPGLLVAKQERPVPEEARSLRITGRYQRWSPGRGIYTVFLHPEGRTMRILPPSPRRGTGIRLPLNGEMFTNQSQNIGTVYAFDLSDGLLLVIQDVNGATRLIDVRGEALVKDEILALPSLWWWRIASPWHKAIEEIDPTGRYLIYRDRRLDSPITLTRRGVYDLERERLVARTSLGGLILWGRMPNCNEENQEETR